MFLFGHGMTTKRYSTEYLLQGMCLRVDGYVGATDILPGCEFWLGRRKREVFTLTVVSLQRVHDAMETSSRA